MTLHLLRRLPLGARVNEMNHLPIVVWTGVESGTPPKSRQLSVVSQKYGL
jgi:hypothetical protein